MKYILGMFLTSIFFMSAVYSAVEATNFTSPHNKTRVRGNVYDYTAGNWVSGTTVAVTCQGITLHGVTTSTGLYVVDFNRADCPKFSMVSATVTHAGETLSQAVQVSNIHTATMDFNFGAIGVPEMGMIPGIVAAVGSGVAYLGMKKRT